MRKNGITKYYIIDFGISKKLSNNIVKKKKWTIVNMWKETLEKNINKTNITKQIKITKNTIFQFKFTYSNENENLIFTSYNYVSLQKY